MPEVEEVFRMATQKVRPDPGAIERQNRAQRRRNNRRKAGVYVLVACLTLAVVVFALEVLKDQNTTTPPAVTPSATGQTLSIVNVGSGETTLFTTPEGASWFDVTLDGSMITYIDADADGNDQIFVMDADGANQRQLTHGTLRVEAEATPPQWSPDGSTIAYWVNLPKGGVELFEVRLSDGRSTRITHEPNDVYEGGWASDRSFVFSISNPRSQYPLLARSIDVETGETNTIARDVSTPEVSPDGERIAFDSYFRPPGSAWLSLMNTDGTGRRKIERASYGGSYPKWSPDSTQIAYIDNTPDGGLGIYVYDLAAGTARFVTSGTIESWIDDGHILVS